MHENLREYCVPVKKNPGNLTGMSLLETWLLRWCLAAFLFPVVLFADQQLERGGNVPAGNGAEDSSAAYRDANGGAGNEMAASIPFASFRIIFGLRDTSPRDWSGQVLSSRRRVPRPTLPSVPHCVSAGKQPTAPRRAGRPSAGVSPPRSRAQQPFAGAHHMTYTDRTDLGNTLNNTDFRPAPTRLNSHRLVNLVAQRAGETPEANRS